MDAGVQKPSLRQWLALPGLRYNSGQTFMRNQSFKLPCTEPLAVLRYGLLSALFLLFACLPARAATNPTTTTLAITANGNAATAVPPGTVVTLSASVTAAGVPVFPGTVTFCDAASVYCTDIHSIGSAQLTVSGVATLRFKPGLGTHSYKAVFSGTSANLASSSPAEPVTVATAGTTQSPSNAVLAASGVPGNYTLTATVSGNGVNAPTGAVSFFDTTNANYLFGTATLGAATSGVTFTPSTFPTDTNPIAAVVADFNNDGILDIAVTMYDLSTFNTTGELSIFLGNGDGTFQSPKSISLGMYPYGLAAGDFNSDGKIDLVVTDTRSNQLYLLQGAGDGTFTKTSMSLPGSGYNAITFGDFNGDGIPDLIASGADTSFNLMITILLGKGDGTFTASSISMPHNLEAYQITIGDFNGDGKQDVALCALDHTTANVPGSLVIMLGNGNGTFATPVPYFSGPNQGYFAMGDFNRDGKLDFALSNTSTANLNIFLGNGDGTFTNAGPTVNTGFAPGSLSVADFDGDGIADIAAITSAAGSGPIHVLLGHGDGTFTSMAGPNSGVDPLGSISADFNGDGVPDIEEVNLYDKTIGIYLTSRGGTATASIRGVSPIGTGTHYAQATYGGDSNYLGSISNTVPLVAVLQATTLTLTAAPTSIRSGQQVVLTANLTPASAQNHIPTGQVTFYNGAVNLGSVTISGGIATLAATTLPVGTNNITASYSGDSNFAGTTSNSATVVVGAATPPPAATILILTARPTSITFGQQVVLTADLAITSKQNYVVTGQVTFYNGSVSLGSVAINNTVATLAVTTLPVGTDIITASYSGDANYAASVSNSVSVLVSAVVPPPPASITVQAVPQSLALTTGHHVTIQVTVSSSGYSGPVVLSTGVVPLYSTFIFKPSTLQVSSGSSQSSSLYIDTDQILGFYSENRKMRFAPGSSGALYFAFSLPLALLPVSRRLIRKRRLGAFAAFAMLISVLMMSGCSSKWPLSTPPGAYTVQIQASAASGSLTASTSLPLVVNP